MFKLIYKKNIFNFKLKKQAGMSNVVELDGTFILTLLYAIDP